MDLNSIVNNEGIAHIGYKVAGVEDIVNQYSIENYELLNPDFESYMGRIIDYIPEKTPIILEIIGGNLSIDEQSRADNAVWNHYLLKLTDAKLKIKRSLTRTFWYFLSIFASALLIYYSSSDKFSDLATQFLYLPIWYFAYRVLTYPIFDCIPLMRQIKKLKQLAAIKLKFSQNDFSTLSKEECEETKQLFVKYYNDANSDTRYGQMIDHYILEGDTADLCAKVNSIDDIIRPSSMPGYELICDSLSYYLSKAEKFIDKDIPVKLSISGCEFSNEEKDIITRALRNHTSILKRDAKNNVLINKRKIIAFSICLAISILFLVVLGPAVDVAVHELIIILFWFFADYLAEFILISNVEAKKTLAATENIEKMEILFS